MNKTNDFKTHYLKLKILYYLKERKALLITTVNEVFFSHLTFTVLPFIIAYLLKDILGKTVWLSISDLCIANLVLSGYSLIQFAKLKIEYQGDYSDNLYNGILFLILLLIFSSCLYVLSMTGEGNRYLETYSKLIFIFNVIVLALATYNKQTIIYRYEEINTNLGSRKYSDYLYRRIQKINNEIDSLKDLVYLRGGIDQVIINEELFNFKSIDSNFLKEIEKIEFELENMKIAIKNDYKKVDC